MEHTTDDYRNAPSNIGPLASTWDDKPHRLVYDLCRELEKVLAERDAAYRALVLLGRDLHSHRYVRSATEKKCAAIIETAIKLVEGNNGL